MQNTLYTHDNLFILNGLNSESVDLIYLDPPFNSKRIYSAPIGSKSAGASFKDMWSWADIDQSYLDGLVSKNPALVKFIQSIQETHSKAMMAYVTYMTQRILEMHRILKNTGSIYVHIDPTASHYLKILLDIIFGKNNFKNEIIWYYKNASRGKKRNANSHDVILWYSKTENYIFNREDVLQPFDSNMTEWRYTKGGQKGGDVPRGKTPDDVITLPSLNTMAKERTGYPTQKPLALLHRIIKASSDQGDVVLDPFCGCATTCVAAQQLNRKWIGIDIEEQASSLLVERLTNEGGIFSDFVHTKLIPKRDDVEEIEPNISVRERLYKEQEKTCNGCYKEFDDYNLEIDHVIPKSKGGGNYYENYQLLCSNCNKVKGDRPMEYLRNKIEAREKLLKHRFTFGE